MSSKEVRDHDNPSERNGNRPGDRRSRDGRHRRVTDNGRRRRGSDSAFSLPRSQTFYMSGNQWSPNNDVNPAKTWDYVTGLVGFAYETPFRMTR